MLPSTWHDGVATPDERATTLALCFLWFRYNTPQLKSKRGYFLLFKSNNLFLRWRKFSTSLAILGFRHINELFNILSEVESHDLNFILVTIKHSWFFSLITTQKLHILLNYKHMTQLNQFFRYFFNLMQSETPPKPWEFRYCCKLPFKIYSSPINNNIYIIAHQFKRICTQ